MAHRFPTVADEILGVHEVERAWYWCINAMVRTDFQGQGIMRAMFDLVFQEVRPSSIAVIRFLNDIQYRLKSREHRLD